MVLQHRSRAEHGRRSGCWMTLAAVLLAGCGVFRDWNEDGIRLVACGGDSNTVQLRHKAWCAYLRDELGEEDVRTRASAWASTRAVDTDKTVFDEPVSSAYWVDLMLRWPRRPDVAILAWGTNDIGVSDTRQIAEALADRSARLRRAGVGVLVATVPLAFGDAHHNALAEELNVEIRRRFAPCLVDFTTITPPTKAFYLDRLHLNDTGQRRRAAEAARALRAAPRACRGSG